MRTLTVVLLAVGIILFASCKKPNHAPDTPAVPSGPTSCAVGVSYTFSSSATDPDGDSVSVRFDWGDGDTSVWSEYIPSGDTVAVTHSWSSPGTFSVRAQTKDKDSVALAWSTAHVLAVCHEWAKTLARNGSRGHSVRQTQDGGYIITGEADSASLLVVWLCKVGADGALVWDRATGPYGWGHSVRQTRDGGYIVVGSGATGDVDLLLIKTDAAGDTVWSKTFGGPGGDYGYSVQQTADGGFIVTGYTESYGAGDRDVWLIKTDGNGDTIWTRTYGGTSDDEGQSVQQTSDGGYIVAGYTWSHGAGGFDMWLLKTDEDGDAVWSKVFGGQVNDKVFSVLQTEEGGYIAVGSTESYGAGSSDVWLVRTDGAGNKLWDKTLGGSEPDEGGCIERTRDGGYIVVGPTNSYGAGDFDVWLIKTDANGDTVWTRTLGGSRDDMGWSVQQTQDGGYIIVGYTFSFGARGQGVWLIKTGPNGELDTLGGK